MNSNLLNTLGMGNIDPAYIFIGLLIITVGAIILAVVCLKKMSKLEARYTKFMKGKDGKSLEEAMISRFENIENLLNDKDKKTKEISEIFDNLKITVQKVGIVKYDAFSEMGGKLSFALVMLNKENTGFVINAMHSREGCYTYVKEIIKGESYIPLGTEEKEALDKAMEE